MGKILPQKFFERKTELVAKELLGKMLVRSSNGVFQSYLITEVEAYVGPHDLACHSFKGRTPRTEIMYMDAGTIYIYLIYGMHYMVNIVTERKEFPAAVLIRAVQEIQGPGLVARKLKVDKNLNGLPLSKRTGLWVEDVGTVVLSKDIIKTPRIGVTYAGELWANKKLRFVLKN